MAGITVKDEYISGETPGSEADYAWYNNLALYYTSDGKLWRVLWDRWQVDQYGDPDMQAYQKLAAREFFYDGPRQRYLVRDVDPDNYSAPLTGWEWTDY